MRKIPEKYDDHLDNFFINIIEHIMPFFKCLNFTPNMITTLSLFFGLISAYFLNNDNLLLFSITFLFSYFFDIADGHYARKYNMTSTFGDYYDHFKDNSVGIILFYIIHKKYNLFNHKLFVIIYLLFYMLALTHIGCQEKIYSLYSNNISQSLKFTTYLCSGNPYEKIYLSRLFGTGTLQIVAILLIILLKYAK